MIRIRICYAEFRLATQTVPPTIHGFQDINICIQHLDSNPHKPIFYPFISYDGSNIIILRCSGNQVKDTTQSIIV